MDPKQHESRLANISTLWTIVSRAHAGGDESVAEAQRQLVERYGKAVYRYLLGALRDTDAAEELAQEFALQLLEGGLRRANREKGRFRDFVKGVLFHLIANHHRRRKAQPRELGEQDAAALGTGDEAAFDASWRDELMNRAWHALEHSHPKTGPVLAAVLRFRARNPSMHSNEMAEALAAEVGKPVSAAWVRQNLHRARDKFADVLVQEVVETLAVPTRAELDEELSELGLRIYCEPALKRREG